MLSGKRLILVDQKQKGWFWLTKKPLLLHGLSPGENTRLTHSGLFVSLFESMSHPYTVDLNTALMERV